MRASEFNLGSSIDLECEAVDKVPNEPLMKLGRMLQCPRVEMLAPRWFQLIRRYSGISFSFHPDRLTAQMGIITAIESTFHDQYVADNWQPQLLSSATWYVRNYPLSFTLPGLVMDVISALERISPTLQLERL